MVRLPRLPSTVERNGDVEGDWVTIATVVAKLPPKDTVKGKKFVVWEAVRSIQSVGSCDAVFVRRGLPAALEITLGGGGGTFEPLHYAQ